MTASLIKHPNDCSSKSAAWCCRIAKLFICLIACLLMGRPGWSAQSGRPVIMVSYFEDNTGRKEWVTLPKALAGMLITDLAKLPTIRVVERERLETVLKEINLQKGKYFDPATAQKLGKGLGAQFVLMGSIFSKGSQLRFDARIIRVETAEVVKTAEISGESDQIFLLQKKLVAALGLATPLDVQAMKQADQPGTPSAVAMEDILGYGRGLQLSDAGANTEALEMLKQILKRSPGFQSASEFYRRIMGEIAAARSKRQWEFNQVAADVERKVKKALEGENPDAALAHRILRGQLLLVQLKEALADPECEYLPYIDKYVENQICLADEFHAFRLIKKAMEQRQYPRYRLDRGKVSTVARQDVAHRSDAIERATWSLDKHLDPSDMNNATGLGVRFPGTYHGISAHRVKKDLAQFILKGLAPGDPFLDHDMRFCWHKLDPSLEALALQLLKEAREDLQVEGSEDSAEETVELLTMEAWGNLGAGNSEAAVLSLKVILETFPRTKKFKETESLIRRILEGQVLTRCVEPPQRLSHAKTKGPKVKRKQP